jgi:hypothetical protein
MEAVYYSETLVSAYMSTRSYTTEDDHRSIPSLSWLKSRNSSFAEWPTEDIKWIKLILKTKLQTASLIIYVQKTAKTTEEIKKQRKWDVTFTTGRFRKLVLIEMTTSLILVPHPIETTGYSCTQRNKRYLLWNSKVKLCRYRHAGDKWERRYCSNSFLTSALNGVSGQRYASAVLYPLEKTTGTHWTGGWVSLTAGLDTEAREKIFDICRGSNPCRPVCRLTLYWVSYALFK